MIPYRHSLEPAEHQIHLLLQRATVAPSTGCYSYSCLHEAVDGEDAADGAVEHEEPENVVVADFFLC